MKQVTVHYLQWHENPSLIEGLILGKTYTEDNYEVVFNRNISKEYSDQHILKDVFNLLNEDDRKDNIRSMCVGDIIQIDDKKFIVKPIGFEEIK